MKMNVLTYFPMRPRYYLRHPFKFLKECKANITNAWMRVARGWCWMDLWNMNDHLLEIIPDMLRELAAKGSAYPGKEPFETPEKWHDWLVSLAADFESCREDALESGNEYYNDYIAQFEGGNFNKETTELDKRYFAREVELYEQMRTRRTNAFHRMIQFFDLLWD